MSESIRELQIALGGLAADGVRGPVTTLAILAAADAGRLQVKAALPTSGSLPIVPWIEKLKEVFGLHEVRDRTLLMAWLRSDGRTLGDPSVLPWCGDAVETSMRLALPTEPFPGALGSNPYFARNWSAFGVAGLSYGSVGVFERGPSSGHVGYLVGQDAECFHVFGGNQGDQVGIVRIYKSRLLAARWPKFYAPKPVPLPTLPTSVAVSVNEI